MAIASGPTRRRRLGLTPLIDVIFLLLLFFMLSSTFLRFAPVEVSTTRAPATGADPGRAALLVVRSGGALSLNGTATPPGDLVAALAALEERGTVRLLVSADAGASVQDLVAALERLKSSPLPPILIGRPTTGAAP